MVVCGEWGRAEARKREMRVDGMRMWEELWRCIVTRAAAELYG